MSADDHRRNADDVRRATKEIARLLGRLADNSRSWPSGVVLDVTALQLAIGEVAEGDPHEQDEATKLAALVLWAFDRRAKG